MSSKVYFSDFRARNPRENKINKLQKLLNIEEFNSIIKNGDLVAVKVHFGEIGNDTHISPIFIKPVTDRIKNFGGKPFLTDTNTLYTGTRYNAVDHLNTASAHGFVPQVTGAPVIISDGLKSDNFSEVEISKTHFKNVKIADDINNADSMIVVSHFKGHEMAGFGGTIKNLAMGCAPAAGKRDQHATTVFVIHSKCVGCGECVPVCQANAISMSQNKANINKDLCTGCGQCIATCPIKAIGMDWNTENQAFIERMTEYAYGSIKNKTGKVFFINFIMNVTPDCDCAGWSDSPIVPDVGIAVSTDPVALDKASFDLVNNQKGLNNSLLESNHEAGCDKFRGMREHVHGDIQFTYGETIGLGNSQYELIKI